MFGKKECFNCSEKAKKVHMAKTVDGQYLCRSCQGLLSRYYPGCFVSTKDEVMEHLGYMKKMKRVYEGVFSDDEEKITVMNTNLGIVISPKTGFFKVIDNEWGEFNSRADVELFRLDQINRYEVYSNHKQGVYVGNGAFIDCGVKVYMNNTRKEVYNKYKPAKNHKMHPYVFELDIVTASDDKLTPMDTFENQGLKVAYEIADIFDRLLGTDKETVSENRVKFAALADEFLA